MDELAHDVIHTWERLKSDRGTWESHWQQCSDFMSPDRADYLVHRTPGQKRMTRVFDSTPIFAAQQYAAGMHGRVTSPDQRWFGLKAEDEKLNEVDEVALWNDDTSNVLYGLYSSPRHNFAAQSHEFYGDHGVIGTAIMAVLESPKSGILFSTRHLRECCIAENDEGRVDLLSRRWEYTARQAYAAWGDAAGKAVYDAFSKAPDRKMAFHHRVMPRRNRDPQRGDRRHMAFESVYVSESDGTLIDVGGFQEFPYLVARQNKAPGETYGRGSGMVALPDVKMLNEFAKTVLKAAQKVIDPPLQVPDDGFTMPIRTTPGGLNYFRAGMRDRIVPIETGGEVKLGIEMISALRQQIIKAFYGDLMMTPSDPSDPASAGKGVTATFTHRQWLESMVMLSPILGRLNTEFAGPLIDRSLAILWRQSAALRFGPGAPLKPPPQQLSGAKMRIEYVSPVAIAQRASQIDAIMQVVQTAQALQVADPNVPRILDAEAILRLTARGVNAPAVMLKSAAQVAADAKAAADAQQAMNAHAAVANLAGALKDGGAGVKSLVDATGQVPQQAGTLVQQQQAAA